MTEDSLAPATRAALAELLSALARDGATFTTDDRVEQRVGGGATA